MKFLLQSAFIALLFSSPSVFAQTAPGPEVTRPRSAQVTPPPPPPKAWKVMVVESVGTPTGNSKTYTLRNGALTPVPSDVKIVPWGTPCDCSKGKFTAADQAYCPWVGQTTYVARCQQQ